MKEISRYTVTSGTASQETKDTGDPIQQVWLYLNSNRALCGSAGGGQGYCAGTCRDKNVSFMSQDRNRDQSSSVMMIVSGGQGSCGTCYLAVYSFG